MLPFVLLDAAKMWPLKPFGIFFVLGAYLADTLAAWRGRVTGRDEVTYKSFRLACVLGGIIIGHWIDMLFYHPGDIIRAPIKLLMPWDSMSSTGTILGAFLGTLFWKYFDVTRTGWRLRMKRRDTPEPLLPYIDLNFSVTPIAFGVGRVGCALVHDHPGKLAPPGSPFALAWPLDDADGIHHIYGPLHVVTGGSTSRYDLGLLEAGVLAVMAVLFAALWPKQKQLPDGTFTGLMCLIYGIARFFLDMLRLTDGVEAELRYFGFTFAQYWSMVVVVLGAVLLFRVVRAPRRIAAPQTKDPA
jgi:phosphatidylglycerol---prolipoprotein diacylglyceryl transferase